MRVFSNARVVEYDDALGEGWLAHDSGQWLEFGAISCEQGWAPWAENRALVRLDVYGEALTVAAPTALGEDAIARIQSQALQRIAYSEYDRALFEARDRYESVMAVRDVIRRDRSSFPRRWHVLVNDDGTYSFMTHVSMETCAYCLEGMAAEPHRARLDPYGL